MARSEPPWLILKVGSTVELLRERRGDFEDWFRAGLGCRPGEIRVVRPHEGETPSDPRRYRGVIVTGSPAMVTDEAPWSLEAERWMLLCTHLSVPLLGVCYGHQLLARAFGGRVENNPRGREIGTVRVRLTDAGQSSPIFAGMDAELRVQTTHSQSITSLPYAGRLLAGNEHDPNQAFAIGPCSFGVQFHPEFDADIVRGYAEARGEDLRAEGLDPEAIHAGAEDSTDGARVLENFAQLVAAIGQRTA